MAAQNFYKKDGSYYLVGSNQKILNLQQLQQYASGGGREVSYTPPTQSTPPAGSVAIPAGQISNYNVTGQFGQTGQAGSGLWGTPINNNISSSTLETGMNSGNISSQIPPTTASTIAEVEAQNAKNFSQGATGMLSIFDQQRKDAEAKIKEAESKIAELNTRQQNEVTNPYNDLSQPFRQTMEEQGNIKYKLEEKYQKYSALASSLVTLSEIAYNDIVTEKNRPALLSISNGRTNAIKEDYNSKIALTKTAMSALSDDISMGRTFIDRGIEAVVADRTDRLNFLQFVNGLITDEKKDAKASLIQFSKDEKDAIDNQISTLQSEFKRIDEEKGKIQDFLLGNSELALKAGVSLAEPYDTMVEKVSSFIKKNPQYSEQNVDVLTTYIKQYPDAGITFNDMLQQAQAKILRSPEYKKSVRVGGSGGGGGKADTEEVTFDSALSDTADYLVDLRNKGKLTDLSYSQAITAFMSDFGLTDDQRGLVESQINNVMSGGVQAQIQQDNNPTSDFYVDTGRFIEPAKGNDIKKGGGLLNTIGKFFGMKDNRVGQLQRDYPQAGITSKDSYNTAVQKVNRYKASKK